jgi:geranylgeranyl diphosphate synthase type I
MPEPASLAVGAPASTNGQGAGIAAAGAILASTRAVLDPFLRDAVGTMPGAMRHIASYHLGWVDEHGRPVVADPGKAVRPTLVLLAAEAVGGDPDAAMPAAAAVELAHNFSLVHDDVIDGDHSRRHRPTAWSLFGTGPAILAGDALLALAYDVLASSGHPAADDTVALLSGAVIGLLEGQSDDLAFERRMDVDIAECMAMVERKTALLMGCACASGTLFGGGDAARVERMRNAGRHLGVAFQVVDDVLGIWGDPAVTGKPVWSDLRSRKKTLPVVAALGSETPAGRELAALYGGGDALTDGDLAHAAELVERAGGRKWCDTQLEASIARALRELELAQPRPDAAEKLRSLALLIAGRHR